MGQLGVSQVHADKLITNFVIKGMFPLDTVSKDCFKELIQGLAPEVKVMSRKTLHTRINERFNAMKMELTTKLTGLRYVCTTADIWSMNKKSYMGVTAHWIDINLKRQSVALACRRFKGAHTYDRIALLLHSIFAEFKIDVKKIVATVTDNGANFVKAFKEYQNNDNDDNDDDNSDESDVEHDFNENEPATDADNEVRAADMTAILEPVQEPEVDVYLPPHLRCASHTLNLIGSHDIDSALKEIAAYKRIHNSAMAKCQALWNASSRPKAAETIKDICGKQLLTPCATRWNSKFDSVCRLTQLKPHLKTLCTSLSLPLFKDAEINFLEEYVLVLGSLATAIDILQGENQCYLGYLLPTILEVKNTLHTLTVSGSLVYAQPLAHVIMNGLQERFGFLLSLEDTARNHILASMTLPYFKLRWVPKEKRESCRNIFMQAAQQFVRNAESNNSAPETVVDKQDKFFKFTSTPINVDTHDVNRSQLSILQYLDCPDKSLDSLKTCPMIEEMFLKYNTPLPSSAPVERLFSVGGMIFTKRRNGLADEMFEKLLLLTKN